MLTFYRRRGIDHEMHNDLIQSNCDFIAFIDEAGDTGLNKVQPLDSNGASEWLALGCVLVRAQNERHIQNWVDEMREGLGVRQRGDLHFRDLSPTKRKSVCEQLATHPVRCFSLLSNKKNMRNHYNNRAERVSLHKNQWFYNFCTRLLLERVTSYVYNKSIKLYGEPRYVKFVFSERGGIKYRHMKTYHQLLINQTKRGTLYLTKRSPRWEVMRPSLIEDIRHNRHPGLQLADIVASAFYNAAHALAPRGWDPAPAKLLKPRIATENNEYRDFGLILQPTPPARAKLTPAQQQIFRFYGYRFSETFSTTHHNAAGTDDHEF